MIKYINNIYILSVALTLSLHVFNFGGGDTLKPFHISAVIASFLSFFVIPLRGEVLKYASLFVFVSLISTLFSYSDTAMPYWINLTIIICSSYGLAYVDIHKLVKCLFCMIPVDVIVLFYKGVTEYYYRFKGFYSDPNYLCTTLLVFLLICFFIINHTINKWIKILMVVTIILIYSIILMTISRTGIACSILILTMFLLNSLKQNLFKASLIILLAFLVLVNYANVFLEKQGSAVYERIFETNDNIEEAGSHRFELSMQNIDFIIDHPPYILFGLGGGTSVGKGASQVPGLSIYRKSPIGDHNSWTSTFSEQGIICLFLFFLILLTTFKNILKIKDQRDKYIFVVVFLSILIFSFSISQKVYLPFWWVVFFFNNNQILSLKKSLK